MKIRQKVYDQHRRNTEHKPRYDANNDIIKFKISFEDWCAIWDASGKFDKRGACKGGYVMARHNDIGHYEVGNVKIITHSENLSEAHKGRTKKFPPRSAEHRKAISDTRKRLGMKVQFKPVSCVKCKKQTYTNAIKRHYAACKETQYA